MHKVGFFQYYEEVGTLSPPPSAMIILTQLGKFLYLIFDKRNALSRKERNHNLQHLYYEFALRHMLVLTVTELDSL